MNYNALNASVDPETGHNTSSSANPLNYVDSANAIGYINELSAGARSDEYHSTPSSTEVNNDILRENVGPEEVRITSSSANPQNYIDSINDRIINNELLEYVGTNEAERNHDRIRALKYLRTYFNRPRSRFITRDTRFDINTNLQNEFIEYGTLTRYL